MRELKRNIGIYMELGLQFRLVSKLGRLSETSLNYYTVIFLLKLALHMELIYLLLILVILGPVFSNQLISLFILRR